MPDADPPKKSGFVRSAASLGILVLLMTSARSTLADHYTVPSGSMKPTIQVGDRILVNKLAFGIRIPFSSIYLARFDPPERGDVVILRSPADGRTLVKRVMGLPGEEIEVRDGRVFINGERIEENHPVLINWNLPEKPGGPDFGPTKIPDDQFLVLGDNRPESFDGRLFGLVPHSEVYGKAERIYFRDTSFTWQKL